VLSNQNEIHFPNEELPNKPETPYSTKSLPRKPLITNNISGLPVAEFDNEIIETKDAVVKIDFSVSRGENESIPLTNITLSGNNTTLQLNETQTYVVLNYTTMGVYSYILTVENALNVTANDTIQVFYDLDPPSLNLSVIEKYSHYGILIESYENDKHDVGIDIVEIRLKNGISVLIKNFKPYIREYRSERLIHIAYDYYPDLPSGNYSINVTIYDKLGNHSDQVIILFIPGRVIIDDIGDDDNDSSRIFILLLSGLLLIVVLLIRKRRQLQ